MADVESKQQTTALFLSTIVTCARIHTELTAKLTDLMGNLCCAREHSVQLFVQFFNTVKLHSLTYRGADKSLARPGRKQARKHVRDERDFNNIETRAFVKFFFPARQEAEGNSRHSDRNISFFSLLVGLRTYQHPCGVYVAL